MKLFKSASENRAIALKTFLGTLLLGGLLTGFTPSAQATLIGQTVGCSVPTSTVRFDFDCSSETAVVQSPGSEFDFIVTILGVENRLWDLDIEESSIHINLTQRTGTVESFEALGVVLTDLFWLGSPDAVITGFQVDVNGVSDFRTEDISFSDNAIGFNLGTSAVWSGGSSVTIDLITDDRTSVPEPATLALFGLGLAGLGFARRRKTA